MRLSLAALVAVLAASAFGDASVRKPACRCLPGDSCWPSPAAWSTLKSQVGGRLIQTVPIGTPCHDPTFNSEACATLQADWELPQTHYVSSSSVMQAFFANQSCDPFSPESKPCVLGNYVSYAVNVSSTADVAAALAFATKYNIRVVVRNTGHDFFGRSTGAGALAIWTHNLKSTSIITYKSSAYTGPAITVGAGVQGFELLEAAHSAGYVAVTGECPTVGVAGGFSQGGGHSALSTAFGLGADQALEFEVVTAAGTVVTASCSKNSDLFWALSGGGPGYGVVVSATLKIHPEATVGGATLEFAAASTTTENFNQAISQFHTLLPAMIDHGAMVVYYFTNEVFIINPVTMYNSTSDFVNNTLLAPFTAVLNELGIPFLASYTQLSYFDHYSAYMGPLPNGNLAVEDYQYGSRLIPRSVLENDNDALQLVLQNFTAQGVLAVGSSANYGKPAGVNNAVLPAWRTTTVHMQLATPWNDTAPWAEMVAAQQVMTYEIMPQIEAVTPNSGAYMNEGDFQQPNWQQTFFGSNYNTLLGIKQKWDPNSLFYGNRLVGSEAWTVDASGRMCPC